MATRAESPLWDEYLVLREMEFDGLVDRYLEIKDTIDALEVEKKTLGQSIEAALVVADQTRVRYNDQFVIERCNGAAASKIDPRKLAELGVGADTIKQATMPGGKYTYIQAVDMTKKQKGGTSGFDQRSSDE